MKIAIIGAGSAGCITALHFHKYMPTDREIVIYHSPNKNPIERVGQSTTLDIVQLMQDTLGCDWYNNPVDATFKSGILYEGWGKKNDKFFHPFPMHTMGMHFVPKKLSNTVIESKHFTSIEKIITDPEREIDADVIFDCRGRHNRDKSNYEPLINPLNSCLLYDKDGIDFDLKYTKAVATPNGWTFVIPNKDSVSYGYLYNNTITSKEDAKEDFLERFNLPEIDGELTFENYMAKNMFVGERTVLNGNMYGFIEPLEATAMAGYQMICRYAWDGKFEGRPLHDCNNLIRKYFKEVQTFILWQYQYGSKYDTPFWEYARSLPFEPDDKFRYMIDNFEPGLPTSTERYGQWHPFSFHFFKDNYEVS